jgi:hypothetical protein
MMIIILNKKFWEELIFYFPFTTIWIFDKNRKKNLVHKHNEVKNWEAVFLVLLMGVIMKYTVRMVSGSMIL